MQYVNVNSRDYWNDRFGSGDWAAKGGSSQTQAFAKRQVTLFNVPNYWSGKLCDFGCGTGDAFPIYHQAYPNAKFIGVDFSKEAIRLCNEKYSSIADFVEGDCTAVPSCNLIIASNVLEHLHDDKQVVGRLLERCDRLFIVVPFRDHNVGGEHLRAYDEYSFDEFSPLRKKVFLVDGWSFFGGRFFYQIYIKNAARLLLGRPLVRQRKQILFELKGNRP